MKYAELFDLANDDDKYLKELVDKAVERMNTQPSVSDADFRQMLGQYTTLDKTCGVLHIDIDKMDGKSSEKHARLGLLFDGLAERGGIVDGVKVKLSLGAPQEKAIAWTPKLETLIRDFGDAEEKNTKDGCNPRLPMPITMLRIAFRCATKSQPLFKKICAEMNVAPDYQTSYSATLQKIIDLSAANNSDAADKLKKKLQFTKELNEKYKGLGAKARIKAAKKGEIKWPG